MCILLRCTLVTKICIESIKTVAMTINQQNIELIIIEFPMEIYNEYFVCQFLIQ